MGANIFTYITIKVGIQECGVIIYNSQGMEET